MKIKFFVVAIFLLAFSINSFAQTEIKVTPKKVTYTRTGEDISEYKKTFDVTYPIITGNAPLEEINKSISYWTNYETTLDEVKEEDFTSEMTYKVNYNGKGILDIQLTNSGSAAYPSDFVKNIVVDLESGKSIKIKDAFTNRNDLYKLIANAQQNEIKTAIAKDKEKILKELIEQSSEYSSIYEIEDFSVSDKGITFIYDYGFNHATLALQPEGRYFFTWAALKPYISEYGIFTHFLTKSKK